MNLLRRGTTRRVMCALSMRSGKRLQRLLGVRESAVSQPPARNFCRFFLLSVPKNISLRKWQQRTARQLRVDMQRMRRRRTCSVTEATKPETYTICVSFLQQLYVSSSSSTSSSGYAMNVMGTTTAPLGPNPLAFGFSLPVPVPYMLAFVPIVPPP